MSERDGSGFVRVQLLQSDEEWAARNAVPSRQMADLINQVQRAGRDRRDRNRLPSMAR